MILDAFRLDGLVALVTGATRGLGQAIAVAMAEAGADVALVGSSSAPEQTARLVQAAGRRALPLVCDLSTAGPAELKHLVQNTVDGLGQLDVLVNNAGIIRRVPALEFSEGDWDDVVAVNQRSLFFLAQAAGRSMHATGGGRIINIASLLSFQGGINVASYTASKHAVVGLTKALANEWASSGVNAIVPGYISTDNTAALRSDPVRSQAILDRIPAGRWGVPQDLQGAAVFLASPASSYVHGSTLTVDGGWLAR